MANISLSCHVLGVQSLPLAGGVGGARYKYTLLFSEGLLSFLAIKIKLMKGWVILCDFFNNIFICVIVSVSVVHIRDGGGAS